MVYGEVGKLLLQVTIDKHMINYWISLLNKDSTSYASIIYTITLKLFISGEYKTQWLSRVKGIIDNCGLSYIWLNQYRIYINQCKFIIHKRMEDVAQQKRCLDLSNSSMCITYKLFKTQLHFEKYIFTQIVRYIILHICMTPKNVLCVTWMHLVMNTFMC